MPDTMYWYFADECASWFPYRHGFGTHYQWEEGVSFGAVGERPGPRPWNRGNGPIGKSTWGILPLGDPNSFVEGVPSNASFVPANCPNYIDGGTVALPPKGPPDSLSSFPTLGWDVPGAPPEYVMTGDGPFATYSYYALGYTLQYHVAEAHWSYSTSGMKLVVKSWGPLPGTYHGPFEASFVDMREYADFWLWRYRYPDETPVDSPAPSIRVLKCISH